mgnify:CR=1 FL=1
MHLKETEFSMKLAVIAAGEGSRLRQEGILIPKPLVQINGISLIDRLVKRAENNNFTSVHIIVNAIYPELFEYVKEIKSHIPIFIKVKTTESSMHSFYELSDQLADEPFLLTTVDPIFNEDEFKTFISFCKLHKEYDGIMAVTKYVDDEKPLWVETNSEGIIQSFQSERNNAMVVSGGFYYLTPKVMPILHKSIDEGICKMRNFQQALINNSLRLKAYEFTKIIDIDHFSDIQKASDFLK